MIKSIKKLVELQSIKIEKCFPELQIVSPQICLLVVSQRLHWNVARGCYRQALYIPIPLVSVSFEKLFVYSYKHKFVPSATRIVLTIFSLQKKKKRKKNYTQFIPCILIFAEIGLARCIVCIGESKIVS